MDTLDKFVYFPFGNRKMLVSFVKWRLPLQKKICSLLELILSVKVAQYEITLNLLILFLDRIRPPKRLISTKCSYFQQ